MQRVRGGRACTQGGPSWFTRVHRIHPSAHAHTHPAPHNNPVCVSAPPAVSLALSASGAPDCAVALRGIFLEEFSGCMGVDLRISKESKDGGDSRDAVNGRLRSAAAFPCVREVSVGREGKARCCRRSGGWGLGVGREGLLGLSLMLHFG